MSPRGRPLCTAILALVTLGLSLSACGGDEGGASTLNWYVFDEPGGSFTNAAKNCSTEGYDIKVQVLPADADQQREQLVRRLAAGDTSIDLIGMDVIWTAEFAGAEWILPLEGKAAEAATKGKLEAAVESATYEDEVYGVPFTSNTQLLWYRKDLVKTPPTTWDEMLDMSAKLEQEGKPHLIQTQGQRYEGLTVLFNTVLASSGGSILNDDATKVSLEEEPTRTALEVLSKYARSDAAPDTLSTSIEDDNRLSFEAGESAFMLNYPFVYPSAEANAPEVFKNLGWAMFPRVTADEPAHVTLGGVNIGVGAMSKHPDEAFEAAACLAGEDNQVYAATNGGLPPTIESLYSDDKVRETYPFADDLVATFKEATLRPQTPLYNDVSLAVSGTLHPLEDIDPEADVDKLRDAVTRALNGEGLL